MPAFPAGREEPHRVIEAAPLRLGDALPAGRQPVQPLHVPQRPGVRLQPRHLAVPAPGAVQHLEQGRQERRGWCPALGQLQHRAQLAGSILRGCQKPGGIRRAPAEPGQAAAQTHTDPPSARHALEGCRWKGKKKKKKNTKPPSSIQGKTRVPEPHPLYRLPLWNVREVSL